MAFSSGWSNPLRLWRRSRCAAGNMIGAGFGLTIGNTDKTEQLYRDVLGFQPRVDAAFETDKNQMLVTGTPGAQFRRSTALVPGTSFQVEFLEFKGIEQKPAHLAIHDPGASVLRLRVRDLDHILNALKSDGKSGCFRRRRGREHRQEPGRHLARA